MELAGRLVPQNHFWEGPPLPRRKFLHLAAGAAALPAYVAHREGTNLSVAAGALGSSELRRASSRVPLLLR